MHFTFRSLFLICCLFFHLSAEEYINEECHSHLHEEADEDTSSFDESLSDLPCKKEAEAEDFFTSSLASTEGVISTIVANSVSAISGELVLSDTDVYLAGPEALVLTRSYSNGVCSEGYLKENWEFNHPSTIDEHISDIRNSNRKRIRTVLKQPNGSRLSLRANKYTNESFELHLTDNKKGITNCSSYEISGRTNVKNLVFKRDHEKKKYKVSGLGGGLRYFECKQTESMQDEKHHTHCFLKYEQSNERKPNGNRIFYKDKKVICTNPSKKQRYSWIEFINHSSRHLEVKTSQGKSVHYHFTKLIKTYNEQGWETDGRDFLTSVVRQDRPREHYSYEFHRKNDTKHAYLNRITRPEGRFLEVEYYRKGSNHLGNNDLCLYRVKKLLAPVGCDYKPVITHRFIYYLSKSTGKGSTDVYDAYSRKTRYSYNCEDRLKSITKYNEQNNPYLLERYVWDLDTPNIAQLVADDKVNYPEDRPNDTNLLGKYLQDGQGTIHSGQFFYYDRKGNIERQEFYGHLSGKESVGLELTRSKLPVDNGAECYRHYYAYSNDKMNLLIGESEDSGKAIQYTYTLKTDLVTSKLLFNGHKLVMREFYDYDDNTTLIKKVQDDGEETDPNNLSGVTGQLVTYFFPRSVAPIGLPERTDFCYRDPYSMQECLLKRICSSYSIEGRLLSQSHFDANGVHRYNLEWEYDNHGNVTKQTNPIGQAIFSRYDPNENLIFQHGPSPDYYTEYAYDFSNRLIRVDERHHDGHHFVTTHKYDYIGNRISTIDRFGNETRYVYDGLNRLVSTICPFVQDENGQPIQPTAKNVYDPFGNIIVKIDPMGFQTHYAYNAYGKPTTICHPDGRIEKTEYNLDGTVAKEIAPNGLVTVYSRDSLGRVTQKVNQDQQGRILSSESFEFKGSKLIAHVDAEGLETRYRYDGAGRIVGKNRGEYQEETVYDPLGRINQTRSWYGDSNDEVSIHAYEYDLLDRVIEERVQNAAGEILKKSNYAYDVYGNRSHISIQAEQGVSLYYTEYNSDKQPIKIVDPLGNTTRIIYDFVRDAFGQNVLSTHTTHPDGKVTIATCDALNRVVNVTEKNAFGTRTANKQIFYDANSNQVKTKVSVVVDDVVVSELVTQWHYNAANQLIGLVEGLGTTDQRSTSYTYNGFGQKVKQSKPDGVQILYSYDTFGRLSTFSSSDDSFSYRYQYNRHHQITSVDDLKAENTTIRTYDSMGRMVSETLSNGLTMEYGFDRLSRPKHVQLPDGTGIDYVYDAMFLRAVNRVKEGIEVYSHLYQVYDPSGALLKTLQPYQSQSAAFKYDLLRRPKGFEVPSWKQSELVYDTRGNLVSYVIEDRAGIFGCRFGYDDYEQIKEESGTSTHVYKCDSVNNRVKKDDDNYRHNALNQLLQQGDVKYQYDKNGNLVASIQPVKEIQYQYDALNRLIAVSDEDNHVTYHYDAFNRRMSKTIDGVTTRYLYQGQDEIGAVDPTGKIVELRILGLGGHSEAGSAVALEFGSIVLIPIHDHRGNVTCLLDQQGEAVETYRFTAFGEESIFDRYGQRVDNSVVGNPWRFSSKRVDQETGLVYFGMRYYSADIGRWITQDPAGYIDGPNLYAYLQNRPLSATDAYGLVGEAYMESRDAFQSTNNFSGGPPVENWSDREGWDRGVILVPGKPTEPSRGFWGSLFGDPWFNRGSVYEVGANIAGACITFSNGILNSLSGAMATAQNISKLAGGANVYGAYNPSYFYSGGTVCASILLTAFTFNPLGLASIVLGASLGPGLDVVRCGLELYGHVCFESVALQHAAWDKALEWGGYILHCCHSEGAIVTRNALETYDPEKRARIIVAAFAPASYIDDKLCAAVAHYVSTRDFVPLFDFEGRARCRHTTTVLKPHPDAGWLDHNVDSPTYRGPMQREVERFSSERKR